MNNIGPSLFFSTMMVACSLVGGAGSPSDDTDSDIGCAIPKEVETVSKPMRIAVLGDRTGHPDDAVFTEILREIARLSPDAVAGVGDLIEGYQMDDKSDEAEAEWDWVQKLLENHLGKLPMYFAAGNHDVWSDGSRGIFERRFNPVNAAYDLGYAALIVFDTSRAPRESLIPDDDLDWLVHALDQYRDKKARIVLTHRPLFAEKGGGAYGTPFHDVLIAGNATYFICGHWHHSMSDDRDDVQYRMLGPSGAAPNRAHHAESGNLAQFGWLVIDETGAHFSIVKGDGVLPSDTFPYEMNQLEWRIENLAARPLDFVIDPNHPTSSGRLRISFTNVTDEQLHTTLSFADTDWRVSPKRKEVQLEPGRSREMSFSFVRKPGSPLFPGPEIAVSFPFFKTVYTLKKSLAPTLRVRVNRQPNAPIVDGDIGDEVWRRASPLGPFMEVRGGKLPYTTDARALVADNTLYVRFRAADPDMEHAEPAAFDFLENADHLMVLFDDEPDTPGKRRIVLTPSGRVSDKWVEAEPPTDKSKLAVAISKDKDGWSAELALPFSELPRRRGERTVGFNFAGGRIRGDVSSFAYWQPLLEHDEESLGKL